MILQELNEMYDIFNESLEYPIPEIGYSVAKIHFSIVINLEGDLIDIRDERVMNNKNKLVPKLITIPFQATRSSNVFSYFLADNAKYLLGLENKKFEDSYKLHHQLLKDIDNNEARAVLNYFEKYNKNILDKEQRYTAMLEDYKKSNFIFKLEGKKGFIFENPQIKMKWKEYISVKKNDLIAQCLVTGKVESIAKTHISIKGVNSDPKGASLVNFNKESFLSYGKKQSFNSPVSEESVFKYATTLNYLLSNVENSMLIGDTKIVLWAHSPKKQYVNLAMQLINPSLQESSDGHEIVNNIVQSSLMDLVKGVKLGKKLNELDHYLDDEVKFFILGLTPNNARLSVRFFFTKTYKRFIEGLATYYNEHEIINMKSFEDLKPSLILYETINKNAKEKKTADYIVNSMMNAILTDKMYPRTVYNAIMQRIKADGLVNYRRVAFVKAYLLRYARIYHKTKLKEEIQVSLNESMERTSYLLGRLFAVLEKIQKEALGDINTTIKDKYFTTATSTPRTVFPVIIKLSQHHLNKVDYKVKYEKMIQSIINRIDDFPNYMNLEDQGLFILGYYQQKQVIYTKNEKIKKEEEM